MSYAKTQLMIGVAAVIASTQVHAAQTGVQGTVSVSPAKPGAQRAGHSITMRLSGATVQLRNSRGEIVASTVSDEQGRFILNAPPGDYKIKASAPTSPFPRCGERNISVYEGHASLDIVCDSGIR